MTNWPSDQGEAQNTQNRPDSFSLLFRWSPLALLLLLVGVVGVGYYTYSTQKMLQERIMGVERANHEHVSNEVNALKNDTTSLASSLKTLDDRVGTTADELDSTSKLATNLRNAHHRLAKTVGANSSALTAVRNDTATHLAAVNTKMATVSTEVKNVSTRLDSTRADLAADRRQLTETATRLSGQIDKNAGDVAELRRKTEYDIFEFDIQKSGGNDVARVEDIRIQLTKTDVRNAKYNVFLYLDDRRIEKKDLLVNQAIQFVVGKDRVHYELVVTAVDRDRIRGYVSVPKERPQLTAQSS